MNDEVKLYSSGTLVSAATVLTGENLVYGSNNSMYVYSGGTANSTVVDGYSWGSFCDLYVFSGGMANGTTVNSYGYLNVFLDGTATGTIVNSRGELNVSSGGTATNTTVNSGGDLNVSSGGTALDVVFGDGGCLGLYGGVVSGVSVADSESLTGYSVYVHEGILTDFDTAEFSGWNGYWGVTGGCLASGNLRAGNRIEHECGSTSDIHIYAGAYQRLFYSNSLARKTTIHSGGSMILGAIGYSGSGSAAAEGTIVGSGGRLYAFSGATATDTTVLNGGIAYLNEGARFRGKLEIAGQVSASLAADLSEVDSIDFILEQASDAARLVVDSGNITADMTITADVSTAYGKYTLIEGGAGQIQSITVTNDGVSKQLSAGNTISITTDKTVKLSQEDSNLYLTVDVKDTTPPPLPDGIRSELAENKLSLSWDEVKDLTGVSYEIECSKDSTFTDSVLSQTASANKAALMLGNGTWYWRMRAVDGAGNYSAWSSVSSAAVNHTDIVEGSFTSGKTFYGDVVVKTTADGECGYPACIRIRSQDCTVTVEGGSLACDSIRNAAILFGEDASWGDYYDGTVTFTGSAASLSSNVSNCITAAGIVGKNLTVNFTKDAENSAGITFHAGQGTGSGDYAAAILADEDLVINGTFGGTVVSLFDFSLISNERWAYAEGFGADETLTINGGISGTILASAYAPTDTANGYGLKAGYNQALTVSGKISGTIAAFGKDAAYALYGGWIEAEISGILIAGKAEAGRTEAQLLNLIQNTTANHNTLCQLASGYNAIYDYNYGTSRISLCSGAEIFGGIDICGSLQVSTGAFISGKAVSTTMTISLDDISSGYVFNEGWGTYVSVTINADNARDGVYLIADSLEKGRNVSVVCDGMTQTWSWGNQTTLTFSNGHSLSFSYADQKLTVTAGGFGQGPVDNVAPDISSVAVTVNVDNSNALISWSAATDQTGVTQYRLRYALAADPENVKEVTVSNLQYQLNDLANGSYFVQIQAGDAAGNWSEWTAQQNFTVDVKSTEVLLPYEVPQGEYMYGCVATVVGMLFGYYDLYGYNGMDCSNIIQGSVDLHSRGTDGNAHDMDAFDTVLGSFSASTEYVSRFYGTSSSAELPYTYVNSDPAQGLNTSVFNCVADWIGTGQYWRSNGDLSTTHYLANLEWLYTTTQTLRIGSYDIPVKYADFKWGMDQYLQTRGYKLDEEKTRTVTVDVNDGDFTFEDYKAEIDAGRPVILSIQSQNGNGHVMLGYGYDPIKGTIIFDDTYTNGKMEWNGTYNYSDDVWRLDSVTTVVFEESAVISAVRSDVDGNCTSDVVFQYTGGDYQIGLWMNGTNTWQGQGIGQPSNWELLGAYDMDQNGKADIVMRGNIQIGADKGAYIGYYKDGDVTQWQNISFLNNSTDIDWKLAIGNLTGNAGCNSLVWHAPDLGALGVWTDGTANWVSLAGGFNRDWTMLGCGDFDGNGKDEVLFEYGGNLYTTDIDQKFASLGGWGADWEVKAIGDFSGDGKDDLILQNGNMVVKFADGKADNWSSVGVMDATDWFIVGAGDYNGDQADDLLVRQYSTGMLGYYANGDMSQWVEMGRGVDMNWTVIA